MQLLVTAHKSLTAAQQASVEAQGTINSVTTQIRETHKLAEGDQIDLASGLITRAPKKARKR